MAKKIKKLVLISSRPTVENEGSMNRKWIRKHFSDIIAIMALCSSIILPIVINDITLSRLYRNKANATIQCMDEEKAFYHFRDTITILIDINSFKDDKMKGLKIHITDNRYFEPIRNSIKMEPYYQYSLNYENNTLSINYQDHITENTSLQTTIKFLVLKEDVFKILNKFDFNVIAENGFINEERLFGGRFGGSGASRTW